MNETSISATRLVIASLWGIVVLLKATAWIVGLATGNWGAAILIGLGIVPAAAGAGVAHVRSYACRVSRQVRAIDVGAAHVPPDLGGLHPIR